MPRSRVGAKSTHPSSSRSSAPARPSKRGCSSRTNQRIRKPPRDQTENPIHRSRLFLSPAVRNPQLVALLRVADSHNGFAAWRHGYRIGEPPPRATKGPAVHSRRRWAPSPLAVDDRCFAVADPVTSPMPPNVTRVKPCRLRLPWSRSTRPSGQNIHLCSRKGSRVGWVGSVERLRRKVAICHRKLAYTTRPTENQMGAPRHRKRRAMGCCCGTRRLCCPMACTPRNTTVNALTSLLRIWRRSRRAVGEFWPRCRSLRPVAPSSSTRRSTSTPARTCEIDGRPPVATWNEDSR